MYAFSSLTFGQSTSKKSFASALTSGGGGISQAALARADAVASQTAGGIDKDLEDKINSLQKDSGYDGNAKNGHYKPINHLLFQKDQIIKK